MTRHTALVTGATGFLGSAICRALDQRGVQVVGVYHSNHEGAGRLEAELSDGCAFCSVDLGREDGVQHLKEYTTRQGLQPDILVHGLGRMSRSPLMMSKDLYDQGERMLSLHLLAFLEIVRRLGKPMLRQRWGRVVAVGSRAGSVGMPGESVYAASKGALHTAVASLAGELGGYGITVNAVAPGALADGRRDLHTQEEEDRVIQRIGLRRLGEGEEVAAAVAFLCSEEASYISGAVLPIDGGARF